MQASEVKRLIGLGTLETRLLSGRDIKTSLNLIETRGSSLSRAAHVNGSIDLTHTVTRAGVTTVLTVADGGVMVAVLNYVNRVGSNWI